MPKQIPSYLRLHVEDNEKTDSLQRDRSSALTSLSRNFRAATGYSLKYIPAGRKPKPNRKVLWSKKVRGSDGRTGHLVLRPARSRSEKQDARRATLKSTRRLANVVADLLTDLGDAQRDLWMREAEVAAQVPKPLGEEQRVLAERLERILQSGAEAVGCQSTAAYLLDEATSHLKMRACWGLPKSKLREPARPLRGAAADLEALVGHAVVLEDTETTSYWAPPEVYPASVCVPISSPTTLLGTLWMFSHHRREFNSRETGVIELVAGRIAAELERYALVANGHRVETRDEEEAQRWQKSRLPSFAPMLDEWQIGGRTEQSGKIGGAFHDWTILYDGRLAIVAGNAYGPAPAAALTAAVVHSSFKSHSNYRHDAAGLVAQVNETLWTTSPGDQFASLFYGIIEPEKGELEYAVAGNIDATLIHGKQTQPLVAEGIPLGLDVDCVYRVQKQHLEPGDQIVVASVGSRESFEEGWSDFNGILACVAEESGDASATEMLEELSEFARDYQQRQPANYSLVVAKRLDGPAAEE